MYAKFKKLATFFFFKKNHVVLSWNVNFNLFWKIKEFFKKDLKKTKSKMYYFYTQKLILYLHILFDENFFWKSFSIQRDIKGKLLEINLWLWITCFALLKLILLSFSTSLKPSFNFKTWSWVLFCIKSITYLRSNQALPSISSSKNSLFYAYFDDVLCITLIKFP